LREKGMNKLDPRVEDWLNARCESDKSQKSYIFGWGYFEKFCIERGRDANRLVDDYRAMKYEGELKKDVFLEGWQDLLRGFYGWLKPKLASLSFKQCLSAIRSYMRFWKVPLEVDLPKHPYVTYHNRDITKEEVKQILKFASPRDRVIYLVLAESGLRSDTAVNLKYWQIKEDFEAKRVPMKIMLPSSSLKYHVGDRWTFIGEDGFRELSDYLARRLPLKDENYVFVSEKPEKVKGDQFSAASLSVKFNRLVQKLGIAKSRGKAGIPKRIRLHGLRKYFRNNHGADSAFINFWMGHSLGTDAHYISRDPEEHRKRYAEGYKALRVFEPNPESLTALYQQVHEKDIEIKEIKHQLETKDKELEAVKSELSTLANVVKQISATDYYKQMLEETAEKTAEKLTQDPEFMEKFGKDFEKLKSGLFKKQQEGQS